MEQIVEIIDKYGRRRRARKGETLADGERFHLPLALMDGRRHFTPTFSDGSPDHTNPYRPGPRFADVDDAGRLAAAEAYEQKRTRLQDAWRNKDRQQGEDAATVHRDYRGATLDELKAAADAAYVERNQRLANAWRNR
ncbi:MAG: hypothetical protein AB7S93_20260 [Xanthobacteraceae bacterium]